MNYKPTFAHSCIFSLYIYIERLMKFINSKRNEKLCPHKNLYTNVYNSIILNSQKVETTIISIN